MAGVFLHPPVLLEVIPCNTCLEKKPMIYDTCTRTITYNGRVWHECVSADSLPANCHMVEQVGVYQFYAPNDNANQTGFFIMCGEYF